MRLRRCLALLAGAGTLVASACTPPPQAKPADPAPASARFAGNANDPASALLEHALEAYFSATGGRHPTVCAKIPANADGGTSELAFMMRFSSLAPLERCVWGEGRYRDAITGDDALVFEVHDLQCADPRRCSAFAGFTAANLGAEYQQYELRYQQGAWHIEPGTLRIVS